MNKELSYKKETAYKKTDKENINFAIYLLDTRYISGYFVDTTRTVSNGYIVGSIYYQL